MLTGSYRRYSWYRSAGCVYTDSSVELTLGAPGEIQKMHEEEGSGEPLSMMKNLFLERSDSLQFAGFPLQSIFNTCLLKQGELR